MKGRRNSVGIFYEILMLCRDGVSKTQAVCRTNLNFKLMDKYIDFLIGNGYIRVDFSLTPQRFILTHEGIRFLSLLSELARNTPCLGAFQVRGIGTIHLSDLSLNSSNQQEAPVSSSGGSQEFKQTLSTKTYLELKGITQADGISIQELLRTVIIPAWLREHRRAK